MRRRKYPWGSIDSRGDFTHTVSVTIPKKPWEKKSKRKGVTVHGVLKEAEKIGKAMYADRYNLKPGKPRGHTTGWVYVLAHDIRPDLYRKIGYSSEMKSRLRNLNAGAVFKYELLAKMPGTYKDEARLKNRFNYLRTMPDGEWFKRDAELDKLVDDWKKREWEKTLEQEMLKKMSQYLDPDMDRSGLEEGDAIVCHQCRRSFWQPEEIRQKFKATGDRSIFQRYCDDCQDEIDATWNELNPQPRLPW